MNPQEISELINVVAVVAFAIWRYLQARGMSADKTREVLTNGYEKELQSRKVATDEWRRFVDREYALDKNRDAAIEVNTRNLSILTERFLSTQDRLIDHDRRIFTLENKFQETLAVLARIENSQNSINHLLVNLSKGTPIQ